MALSELDSGQSPSSYATWYIQLQGICARGIVQIKKQFLKMSACNIHRNVLLVLNPLFLQVVELETLVSITRTSGTSSPV